MPDFRADLSALSWRDAADIALQRTQHLYRFPRFGSIAFRLWQMSIPQGLYFEAMLRRKQIIQGALDDMSQEFAELQSWLRDRPVKRMIDIGCGHALIDLLFYRRYGCSIHLVDIEQSEKKHHDYGATGAGYASLDSARRFLQSNGVPQDAIRCTNPAKTALADADCDLILSLLSCGFHYPVTTYTEFALQALKPGGAFIFDSRKGVDTSDALKRFSRIETISESQKKLRLAAIR